MRLYERFQGVTPKESTCFVLMPFDEQSFEIFRFIKKMLQKIGVSVKNAHDIPKNNVMDNILDGIRDAEYVIVDITGLKPNVMYELGIVHSLKPEPDKVIVISRDDSDDNDVPFNIKYQKIEYYRFDNSSKHLLIQKIKSKITRYRLNNLGWQQSPIKIRLKSNEVDEPNLKVELGFRLTGMAHDFCHYELNFLEYPVAGNLMKLRYCVTRHTIDPPEVTNLENISLPLLMGHEPSKLQYISGSLKFVDIDDDDAIIEFQ